MPISLCLKLMGFHLALLLAVTSNIVETKAFDKSESTIPCAPYVEHGAPCSLYNDRMCALGTYTRTAPVAPAAFILCMCANKWVPGVEPEPRWACLPG